jgi:bifunctional non-homologous end joining protein LigD
VFDIQHDVVSRNSFSFEPMLCQNAEPLPEGHEWRYELKLDGFRAIEGRPHRSALVAQRKEFRIQFPTVVKGLAGLSDDTMIDGEVVALDEHGWPSFNLLQGFGNAQAIVLYAFDLLMLRAKT